MVDRLLITPTSLNIDNGRITTNKMQIRKNAGSAQWRMFDNISCLWNPNPGSKIWMTYSQGPYRKAIHHPTSDGVVDWNFDTPTYWAATTAVGISGAAGEASPGTDISDGRIRTYDLAGRKTFDSEDQSLYLTNYYSGSVNVPARAATNISFFSFTSTIGSCPSGSSVVVGAMRATGDYLSNEWAQASNTLVIDNQGNGFLGGEPWTYRTVTPFIDGTNVRLRENTVLVGSSSLPSVLAVATIEYKFWVGGYN